MKITGQQLKNVVRENKHREYNLDSRLKTEYMIWFTYDVLKEIGEIETANKVRELIEAIDSLDTFELVKLHIWD